VDSIMTPRGDIVWLDIDDTIEEIQRKISATSFSMFPVCRGRLDDVLGIVESRDLLKCNLADHKMDLKSSLMPPLFVPESMRALKVLERFKLTGVHLAVVLDEYGSVQGIVALVDLLEGLVGDIPHIDELEEPQMVKREDGSYLVDGAMTVDEFRDALKLHIQPSEQEGQYKTVGGFMMAHLEKIPAAGDYFEWEGYRFEVVDMDERKVDKVLAAPLPAKRGKREKK